MVGLNVLKKARIDLAFKKICGERKTVDPNLKKKLFFYYLEENLIKTCTFKFLIQIYITRLCSCFSNHLSLIEKLIFLFFEQFF